jgi:tetratricopeptide (TPR) repeat protein
MQLQDVDPQRALQYYDRVLQADPKFSMALLNKGLIYEKMGLGAEAKQCFRNLSPWGELVSRIIVPLGFMVLLIAGGIMMIKRGERTLPILILASAVSCFFWLRRDGGTAITMLLKKKKYV